MLGPSVKSPCFYAIGESTYVALSCSSSAALPQQQRSRSRQQQQQQQQQQQCGVQQLA